MLKLGKSVPAWPTPAFPAGSGGAEVVVTLLMQ